jgi:hypothetical protein
VFNLANAGGNPPSKRGCLIAESGGYGMILVPMISRCLEPGCSTIAMGPFCIAHTPKPDRIFVRGRPWPPPEQTAHGTIQLRPLRAEQSVSSARLR